MTTGEACLLHGINAVAAIVLGVLMLWTPGGFWDGCIVAAGAFAILEFLSALYRCLCG